MPFVERLSVTSSISGKEFKAHRKFAFQILGFGVSFSLYLPVCSAHARNKQASVFIFQPFLEACFQGRRNIFFSSSTHSTPGYFRLLIIPSSHGRIRSLSTGIFLHKQQMAMSRRRLLFGYNFANDGKLLKRDKTAFDLSRACQAYTRCAGISNNETVSQSHAYVSFAFNFHL